jgi:hypothetical protein
VAENVRAGRAEPAYNICARSTGRCHDEHLPNTLHCAGVDHFFITEDEASSKRRLPQDLYRLCTVRNLLHIDYVSRFGLLAPED